MRHIFLALGLLLLAFPAFAAVGVTSPVTLGWTPAVDGILVGGFVTHIDDTTTDVGLPTIDPVCACPAVTVTLPNGPHVASVHAYNTIGPGPRSGIVLFTVVPPDPTAPPGAPTNFIIIRDVPPPPTTIWQSVNLAGLGGTSSVKDGIWTLSSNGRTTWGPIDSAHLVYHLETGDGMITARVDTVTGGGLNARAGLVWRESTDVTARSVSLEVLSTGQVVFIYRSVVGRTARMGAPLSTASLPIYLRLIRTDPVISAAYSLDNVTWIDLGPTEANFAPTAVVGMLATGASFDQPTTATFSELAEQ